MVRPSVSHTSADVAAPALRLRLPQNPADPGLLRHSRSARLSAPEQVQMASQPDKRQKRALRRTLDTPARREILATAHAPPNRRKPTLIFINSKSKTKNSKLPSLSQRWLRYRPHKRLRPRQPQGQPAPGNHRSKRMELEEAKSTFGL